MVKNIFTKKLKEEERQDGQSGWMIWGKKKIENTKIKVGDR